MFIDNITGKGITKSLNLTDFLRSIEDIRRMVTFLLRIVLKLCRIEIMLRIFHVLSCNRLIFSAHFKASNYLIVLGRITVEYSIEDDSKECFDLKSTFVSLRFPELDKFYK